MVDLGTDHKKDEIKATTFNIELYIHFGLLRQKKENKFYKSKFTFKAQQLYQVGLRYTFSFYERI